MYIATRGGWVGLARVLECRSGRYVCKGAEGLPGLGAIGEVQLDLGTQTYLFCSRLHHAVPS